MTRDEIIALAKEAGMGELRVGKYDLLTMIFPVIERFFQLAYAAGQRDEREACAKVFDGDKFPVIGCGYAAAAIRSRK